MYIFVQEPEGDMQNKCIKICYNNFLFQNSFVLFNIFEKNWELFRMIFSFCSLYIFFHGLYTWDLPYVCVGIYDQLNAFSELRFDYTNAQQSTVSSQQITNRNYFSWWFCILVSSDVLVNAQIRSTKENNLCFVESVFVGTRTLPRGCHCGDKDKCKKD